MLGSQTHPAAAIVSRLSTSDTWHGYKLYSGLFLKSAEALIQIYILNIFVSLPSFEMFSPSLFVFG